MSTEKTASDLEEIGEDLHEFDYGNGSIVSILNKMVAAMTDLNDEIASLRKELNTESSDSAK